MVVDEDIQIEKDKGGRPPIVFDNDKTSQVEALSAYLTCDQIADYFGISHTAFQAVRERQPKVSLAHKRGKAKAIGSVAKKLIKGAMDGNTVAAIFYLKTQAGWKESSDPTIVVNVPKGLSDFYSENEPKS